MIKFPLRLNIKDQSIEEADGRVLCIVGFANDYDKRIIANQKAEHIKKALEFFKEYELSQLESVSQHLEEATEVVEAKKKRGNPNWTKKSK